MTLSSPAKPKLCIRRIFGGQRIVVGGHRAPFEVVEELGGVEAEHLGVAEVADHAAAIGAAKGVGRIEHQSQTVALGDLGQRVHGAGLAPDVYADDARGARGDQRLNSSWIDVVRRCIHVTEHRRDLLPLQGVGCGHKGEGRDDDLAAQSEGTAAISSATVPLHMAMQCLTPR